MAKKGTTKKTTKVVEKEEIIDSLDVPVAVMEEKLQTEISENVASEIAEISAKMESIQPNEEFIKTIMDAEPEQSQELINTEVEKIDNLKNEIQRKIDDIVNKNPEVVSMMKKANSQFTNFWNGMEF